MVVRTKTAAGPRRRAVRPALVVLLAVLAAACLPGWRQQAALEGVKLEDITCVDATHCWAVGAEGGTAAVVATSDGSAWTRQTTGVAGLGLRAVTCSSPERCVALGHATVLRTVDGAYT